MVIRLYVEKQPAFADAAKALTADLKTGLGLTTLQTVRIINRYDLEAQSNPPAPQGLEAQPNTPAPQTLEAQQSLSALPALVEQCLWTVFAEPVTDLVHSSLPSDYDHCFAVQYLPGQYDQRADAAAQCMALVSGQTPPLVHSGYVYLIQGCLSPSELDSVKKYLINPVESHEVSLDLPATLTLELTQPSPVPLVQGFRQAQTPQLQAWQQEYALAMDLDDLYFCQTYFNSELSGQRDPTLTELKVLDTYWSDHCRHTTFLTEITDISFEDAATQAMYDEYLKVRDELQITKPICLMDMATLAMKYLRNQGLLDNLDDSAEQNACTVKIQVQTEAGTEPWLLLFKNETHNHPTEIEPFGGAATCIGGAIRDPLSGRGYVYQAMRVTGAADPRQTIQDTLAGKLPQRKIVTAAAAGYSSYGNQIGLATGLVAELYHPGYAAKRMEVGAVIAAVPEAQVRREEPVAGDVIILLGGKTGRDGCGGATGSSKAHTAASLETCSAEVQKGNAPEERKIQRLFRKAEVTKLIKRCNDFGAGGVAVAIGELAAGLSINLDAIPKKYEGLNGTELAISESQERMAVVVAKTDAPKFISLAQTENLTATLVAEVIAEPYLRMFWRNECIVNLARSFIDTNGAKKQIKVQVPAGYNLATKAVTDFSSAYTDLLSDLNVCSQRGLLERFDSTIGSGTILMPLGGKNQATPSQVMVAKIPVGASKTQTGIAAIKTQIGETQIGETQTSDTQTVSVMAYGFDPFVSQASPFIGAYQAVVSSVAKLIAAGASPKECYLSLQEYFAKPGQDPKRWGQPVAALLGALKAQLDLQMAAIGGKDSMSGSFNDLDVPPTLISFSVTTATAAAIISPDLKQANNPVVLLTVAPNNQQAKQTGQTGQVGQTKQSGQVGQTGQAEQTKQAEQAGQNTPNNPTSTADTLDSLPSAIALRSLFDQVHELIKAGLVKSAYVPTQGGIAEAIFKMCLGNGLGFKFEPLPLNQLFNRCPYSFVLELSSKAPLVGQLLGTTQAKPSLDYAQTSLSLQSLKASYEAPLEAIFPTKIKAMQTAESMETAESTKATEPTTEIAENTKNNAAPLADIPFISASKVLRAAISTVPQVLIPVFPGTNCEDDSARAVHKAGAKAQVLVIKTSTPEDMAESAQEFAKQLAKSQILFIPGGFSSADEPDGSGKFITAFLRNQLIADEITKLLDHRQGLVLGICNGFQALIKLGLVPYGKIMPPTATAPTLTYNLMGRHQSRLVQTKVCSHLSPWLARTAPNAIYTVPISHGEGRFVCSNSTFKQLAGSGQIVSRYVNFAGQPSMHPDFNPAGSFLAVEGICSPDGRVLGKMGHSERIGPNLYKNVPGETDMQLFTAAMDYFK